LDPGNTANS